LGWRIVVLMIIAQLVSDFLDHVFEGRPLSGPRRWE
jgi:hypothetical protein